MYGLAGYNTCLQAAVVLVDDEAGRTELADGLVVLHQARRVPGAGVV